jgi:hypothetical protein
MTREQLIKKMLAIKAYLDRQKEAASKGNADNHRAEKQNGGANGSAGKGGQVPRNWAQEWEEEIKRELGAGRRSDLKMVQFTE